jgi:hypothetical protein
MIDRYTIKFGPAVSQKELEKALHEPGLENDEAIKRVHKMKARIEVIGDFEDLKTITAMLKKLCPHGGQNQPRIADTEAG